jgi:hypothetical protein
MSFARQYSTNGSLPWRPRRTPVGGQNERMGAGQSTDLPPRGKGRRAERRQRRPATAVPTAGRCRGALTGRPYCCIMPPWNEPSPPSLADVCRQACLRAARGWSGAGRCGSSSPGRSSTSSAAAQDRRLTLALFRSRSRAWGLLRRTRGDPPGEPWRSSPVLRRRTTHSATSSRPWARHGPRGPAAASAAGSHWWSTSGSDGPRARRSLLRRLQAGGHLLPARHFCYERRSDDERYSERLGFSFPALVRRCADRPPARGPPGTGPGLRGVHGRPQALRPRLPAGRLLRRAALHYARPPARGHRPRGPAAGRRCGSGTPTGRPRRASGGNCVRSWRKCWPSARRIAWPRGGVRRGRCPP